MKRKTYKPRTNCPNGHAYTSDSVTFSDGQKRCIACLHAKQKRNRDMQKLRDIYTTIVREFSLPQAQPSQPPSRCCRICDRPTRAGRTYCSLRCKHLPSSRASRMVERARRMGAPVVKYVDPFSIFERDGYICRLCGVEAPKALRGTRHALAPEVDHVIPLKMGGNHTAENLQCAHRRCNLDKLRAAKVQLLALKTHLQAKV